MELADLYPWGNQDSALFINSYRHVVGLAKEKGIANIKWVWGPAGNNGAEAYYPGDDVVDVVGTTLLYDQYWFGDFKPSFAELSEQRQWLATFNKPVWIVEFGVGSADPVFQQNLINDALANHKAMGFDSLLYLNISDSNIVGPDYRLASSTYFLPPVVTQKVIKEPEVIAQTKDQAKPKAVPKTIDCSGVITGRHRNADRVIALR